MKAIKSYTDSDSDEQKRSSVFEKKINWGDTAELASKKGRQVFQFFIVHSLENTWTLA